MNFYENTLVWIKGELLEGSLVILFSSMTLILGGLFWKFGVSATSKSLIIPMLIIGAIYMSVGITLRTSNTKRMAEFPAQYEANATEFIKAEKERVEAFQYQYNISKAVATAFFIATILIFWLTKSPTWQGIGIGLSYFALAGLVIDFFSEHRAKVYYESILQALN